MSFASPCVTCGRCCRSYVVSLLGYDVWRISRALRLSPELFVLAHDQPEPADDGFLLEPEGWPQGLALDKRGEFAPGQPCVFLVDLGEGHACCGVYEHRPAVCRTYPMGLRNETVQLRDDAECPADAWTAEQLGDPQWHDRLREYRTQWKTYVDIVTSWNTELRREQRRAHLGQYLDYLLNMYDGKAAGPDAELESPAAVRRRLA